MYSIYMCTGTPVGAADNQLDLCRFMQVCVGVYTKPVCILWVIYIIYICKLLHCYLCITSVHNVHTVESLQILYILQLLSIVISSSLVAHLFTKSKASEKYGTPTSLAQQVRIPTCSKRLHKQKCEDD